MMDLYERRTTFSRVYFRLFFPSSKQTIVISRAHIMNLFICCISLVIILLHAWCVFPIFSSCRSSLDMRPGLALCATHIPLIWNYVEKMLFEKYHLIPNVHMDRDVDDGAWFGMRIRSSSYTRTPFFYRNPN